MRRRLRHIDGPDVRSPHEVPGRSPRGFVVKGAERDDIARALDAVARGHLFLGAEVAGRALARIGSAGAEPFPELTEREREILDLVGRAPTNAAIADRLVLSPKTVRNHVSNVLSEIGAEDRTAAVALVRDRST